MTARFAGTGVARSKVADAAALDASLAALEAAGTDHADLALVFVTADAFPRAHEALHAVRRVTGARAVVGCSGAGVLTERGEIEDGSAVAVLVVQDDRFVMSPVLLEDLDAGDGDAGSRLAQRTADVMLTGGTVVVLPDARGLDPRTLLGRFDDALGFVPVVGAVAAGAPLFELFGTDAAEGALAALAVGGPEPVVGVAQGCMPIGEPYVITRADGQLIETIGGRPALDVLKEAITRVDGGPERVQRAGMFAGLAMDPAKSPLERGDFLVRNLVGADRSTGAIAVGEPVRVGQTIQFQIRDAESARLDLRATLDGVARELAGRRPMFGCYFNCAGRGQGLFGVPDHDVGMIRERLGAFPLVGFFGNGEFAPIGRRNYFHTYTGVLAVF